MNKVEIKKIIKGLKKSAIPVNINDWKVSYNKFGDIFVAEKGDKRVLRKNETILADIISAK